MIMIIPSKSSHASQPAPHINDSSDPSISISISISLSLSVSISISIGITWMTREEFCDIVDTAM